jgi:uncharacterized membrane protein YdbT with pleckstrin-like domain
MSYIRKHLLMDEHVVFETKKHAIVFLPALVWLLLFSLILHLHISTYLALFPLTVAVVVLVFNGIDYCFSEYAVTNKRIMMKEGFFWRQSIEAMLTSVAQTQVRQSLLARLCRFGQLNITGFGGTNHFVNVKNPQQFQETIQGYLGRG